LSFTLSQAGMVVHHLRCRQPHWIKSLVFNGIGAVTTAVVLLVIASTKFIHGAWMVIVLIPLLVIFFKQIHRHYIDTAKRLAHTGVCLQDITPLKHTAIVPISGIHPGVIDAVRYAMSISKDVRACSIEISPEVTARLKAEWLATVPTVPLIILKSPFRSVVAPLIDYIDSVKKDCKDDVVTVIIPEFVTGRWYHQFLHNQTALVLYAILRSRRDIIVTSVRYFLG
jgi:hypothetical protein